MSRSRANTSLEIVAVFKGAVLDVCHLQPTRPRTLARPLGLVGGALLLLGLGLFLSQTLGQQAEWTAFQRLAAQAAMTGQSPPTAPASFWVGYGIAVGALGVVALALAVVKASDRERCSYVIGEGQGATLATPPVNLMAPDAFELARLGATGAAGLRFTAEMTGEITSNGRCYSLQEWVKQGWTVADRGVFGTTLPAGARCRLEHGDLVFYISVVDAEVASIGRAAWDLPFWGINGASFVGLGSLLLLALQVAAPTAELALDESTSAARFVGYAQQPPMPHEPELQWQPPSSEGLEEPKPAVPKQAPAFAPEAEPTVRGRPRSSAPIATRRHASRFRDDPAPTILGMRSASSAGGLMTRGVDPIEQAAQTGMLAFADTSVLENEHSRAFSPDSDDKAMWQAMKDQDPVAKPIAGLGLIGKGRGGGPAAVDEREGSAARPASEAEGTDARVLIVRVGRVTARGPRSRAEARSFVVKQTRALRRCYDAGGRGDAPPRGRVTLELKVDASGDVVRVRVSRGRSVDPRVTDCLARVARSWSFPSTSGREHSVVSVPLTLAAD